MRRKLFSSFISLNRLGNFQIRHKVGHASSPYIIQNEVIRINNNQRKYPIDCDLLKLYVEKIYEYLKINELHISITIVSNQGMRDSYEEAFQIRKTTDILAWAPQNYTYSNITKKKSKSNINPVASIIICPDYVQKRVLEDKEDFECGELDLSEDRGVSKRMATIFTVQERIPLLLIHGMLHLIGHDHETDEDWFKMTDMEDEIYHQLITAFPDRHLSV